MRPRLKSLLSKAIDNPDVTLAALGYVLAIPLTIYLHRVIGGLTYSLVGVILLLACLFYLILRHRSVPAIRAQEEATPRLYLLTNIVFFGLLTCSIAAFHMRPDLYTRPLGYFVATAAMAAVIATEILFLPPRKSATYFALFKIVLISSSLVWSHLALYPSIVGVDPWQHQLLTWEILDVGHIPPGHLYSDLPAMHLVSGATSLITGLEYKTATMFSVSLLQVVCSISFIFVLGKLVHSTRAGLLAALFLGTASSFLWFSILTTPQTMGVAFIPIIIYLLFRLRQERPKVSICLSVLLMVVLLATHALAAVMLAVVLLSLWLGFELYRGLRYEAAVRARIFPIAVMLFAAVALSYWALVSIHMHILTGLVEAFRDRYLVRLLPAVPPTLVERSPVQIAVVHYVGTVVPFSERFFNQLGFFLFYALALVGSVALLSSSLRNRYGFTLVIAGIIVLCAAVVGIATDFFALGRFRHLSQVLLAMPVGVALLWIAGMPAKKLARGLLIGIMVLALSFLMIMSPEVNMDNRTLSPNTIVRFGFIESELEAMRTVSSIYDGKIAGDQNYYLLRWLPDLDGRLVAISEQLCSQDFSASRNMLVLIRQEIVDNPLRVLQWAPFGLDYDPREILTEQRFSRVYESGSVSGFVRSE